jgi:long-chain acyl-CoA synthetase
VIDQAARVERWGSTIVTEDVLGHPCLVFEHRPRHVGDLLEDARRFPASEYLVQGGRRITFAAHEHAVRSCARLLGDAGVEAGDRVVLLGANSVEWVVAFWAIIEAGAVVVPGNAWWSEAEIEHCIEVTEPRLVIPDDRRSELLATGRPRLGLDDITRAAASRGPDAPTPRPPAAEDDPAVVLFTSGTTGRPKGAVLSHRALLSTLQALLVRTRRLPRAAPDVARGSRALLSLPLFHIGGLQQILTPMVTGGALVFTEGRFEPGDVVRLLERERINVWSAVPTIVSRVLDHLEATGHPGLVGVRTVSMGGSPVPQALRLRAFDAFPSAARGVAVTYGLSEACGVVATGAGDEILTRPGTVGKPLPVVDICIDQPDPSGTGEIWIRSPSLMTGYWGAGDEQPVTADRWLRTGDIGRLDGDGYLYVTDRSKDIVIRGGENVAASNVEACLAELSAVAEVAVVGLPHPTLGEEVAAVVVPKPGAILTVDELAAHAGARLAYFEVPTRWRVTSELLPKNPTGKILKGAVRHAWMDRISAQDRET